MSQIYQKNCNTGATSPLYPLTTLDNVIDKNTNESLETILQKYNHIYLPFKGNSKALTRQQVPDKLRRRGLWITYKSCAGKTVTEWYNSDNYNNTEWGKNDNWVQIVDKEIISKVSKELTEWFKYPESGNMSGKTSDLLHWYESAMSFLWHKNHNLIPLDSIAFIGQTGQIYVQGNLIGVSTEDFKKLRDTVTKIEGIFSTDGSTDVFGEITKVIEILKGYTEKDNLKSIIDKLQKDLDDKVDKEKGKGLSTNDFTDEYKEKLDNLDKIVFKHLTTKEIEALVDKAEGDIVYDTTAHQYKYWNGKEWSYTEYITNDDLLKILV